MAGRYLGVAGSAAFLLAGISFYQGNEKIYDYCAMPLVRLIDPEDSHRMAVLATKYGLFPKQKTADVPVLHTSLWELQFKNPIGMAAGFDKNAEAVEGLHNMGFGFVEIGTVTPRPQPGNPKPRVFRLPEDRAIINHYGFNNEGHDVAYTRLRALRDSGFQGVIGVNLGKNKLSSNPMQDYVDGVERFSDVADYFVVNVSSPNTPGLRSFQRKTKLKTLLSAVNKARAKSERSPPLLLKIAPDLSEEELKEIAEVIQKEKTKVDGIIVSNTTLSRENLNNHHKSEPGGLSGAPLSEVSTCAIAKMYRLTNGHIPIVGVGGIFDGADAYRKIKAGASIVQLYTSFAYHGPPVVPRIKRELAELLKKDGYKSVTEAVGKET